MWGAGGERGLHLLGRAHWWGGQLRAAGLYGVWGWGRSKGYSLVHYPGLGSLPGVSAGGRQSQVLRTRGVGGKPRLDVPLMSSSKGPRYILGSLDLNLLNQGPTPGLA